jgi:hypothetical protein
VFLRTPISTLAVMGLVLGCATPRTRTAPFRDRPDSVDPGSLIGPFDGKVVDAATGDPIAGALVYATWTFQAGYGLSSPAGFHEEIGSTDANGRYRVRSLRSVPDNRNKHRSVYEWRRTKGSSRLTAFALVVYKRGYVAYRSDRRFIDLGPRLDFAQHQNEIALERWRSEYSHVRHLRYVGGGPAIASLTAWEAEEAAGELAGRRGVAGPKITTDLFAGLGPQRIVAAQLVTQQDIKAIAKFDGRFETGPLNDEPDTDEYSSQHFKALGMPQAYDMAVRVWTVGEEEATKRYARLLEDLPGVEEVNEMADRSLRAEEEAFVGAAFLDAERGAVVLLTCGKSLCDSSDELVEIARKASARLRALAPEQKHGAAND